MLGNRQASDLGEVFPEHVERHAADDSILIVDGDQELPNRLVKLRHRPADHQSLISEDLDLLVDAGNVTHAGRANRQSRNLRSRRDRQLKKTNGLS